MGVKGRVLPSYQIYIMSYGGHKVVRLDVERLRDIHVPAERVAIRHVRIAWRSLTMASLAHDLWIIRWSFPLPSYDIAILNPG